MRKLFLIMLMALSMFVSVNAQKITYRCLHYFEAEIKNNQPIWKETVDIKKKVLIKRKDEKVTISAKKNWFVCTEILVDVKDAEHRKVVWYCKDKRGSDVYVVFLYFTDFTHIYVQYADLIYGYNVVRV